MTGWLTYTEGEDVAELRAYWSNVDEVDPADIAVHLAAAREQCEAFAPQLGDGGEVPEAWRLAQGMQARALYRSGVVGSGDSYGAEGFTVTVFPMDWTVKNLLRPKRGVPVVR